VPKLGEFGRARRKRKLVGKFGALWIFGIFRFIVFWAQ
jgi:hypothetical protein